MEVCSDFGADAIKKTHRSRLEIANKIVNIKDVLQKTNNKAAAAREASVPRSTARYWLSREGKTGLSPAVEDFFESPEGMVFLHQLITSAQFTITQLGAGGVDILGKFLQLSQLDKFVASSHGTLCKQVADMERLINEFGSAEGARLALQMPHKKISVCQDETFHPEICLVAIEPVSNFILLEEYSDKRDAESWSMAMNNGIKDLPVEIIQSTSDEGTGLIKHIEQMLGAHHSPDLFHVQQDITRATSAAINAKIKQADKNYSINQKTREKLTDKYDGARQNGHLSSELMSKLIYAEIDEDTAKTRLDELKKHQTDIQESKKALGQTYHPYDLETGQAQTVEEISAKLEANFLIIQSAAENADLSDNSLNLLKKAHRVFSGLISTITFFWTVVTQQIASLGLSPEMDSLMKEILIPGFYLQIASKKAKTSKERQRIAKLSKELLAKLEMIEGWCCLTPSIREQLKAIAKDCANIFQRSSSCVEGRNGYLSLRHHSSHQLKKRKLGALTVIHNYFIQRPDETTAAERFFDSKPRNLFEYLLNSLDISARPAQKRRGQKMVA